MGSTKHEYLDWIRKIANAYSRIMRDHYGNYWELSKAFLKARMVNWSKVGCANWTDTEIVTDLHATIEDASDHVHTEIGIPIPREKDEHLGAIKRFRA